MSLPVLSRVASSAVGRHFRAAALGLLLLPMYAESMPAGYSAALAEVHARYGRHEKARDLLRDAVAHEQDAAAAADFRSRLVEELVACSQNEEAMALLSDLCGDANPVVAASAKIRLARIDAQAGRADAALDLLTTVATDCPIHELRRSALTILVQLAGENAKAVEVVSLLRERLAKEPQNSDLLDVVAALCDDEERVVIAGNALASNPNDVRLRMRYAETLANAQRYDEAFEIYAAVVRDVPEVERQACEALARIAAARGDSNGLVAAVEQAAAGMPDDIQRDLYLTRTYASLEAWEPAEQAARAACKKAENLSLAMKTATAMELSEALVHLDRMDEARALLQPIADQDTWHGLRIRARELLAARDAESEPEDH